MAGYRIRDKGLLIRDVDGEVLVLDTEADRIHQLNPTASLIWHELSAGASEQDIAKQIAIHYEVNENTACRGVSDALRKFRELKFISDE